MNIGFFSPFLVILIFTLVIKGTLLLGRVEEQTNYAFDSSVHSVLVDTAYAQDTDSLPKGLAAPQPTENHLDQYKEKQESDVTGELVKTADPAALATTVSLHGQEAIPNLSNAELQLLKELSKRRKELDKTQDNITIKEQVLKATEGKLDQKMSELKALQAQLQELMKEYDRKEQGRIMSLVKIYENMKPRDAAKIFDELEMPTLIHVVSNMKEVKVAPILAGMNPVKARDLSMELAKQKTPGG